MNQAMIARIQILLLPFILLLFLPFCSSLVRSLLEMSECQGATPLGTRCPTRSQIRFPYVEIAGAVVLLNAGVTLEFRVLPTDCVLLR